MLKDLGTARRVEVGAETSMFSRLLIAAAEQTYCNKSGLPPCQRRDMAITSKP